MFTTLASPVTCGRHFLPPALYLLVVVLALAFAATLLIAAGLDRYGERLRVGVTSRSEVIAVVVLGRWVWLAPMYGCALLIAVWLVMRAP